MLLNKLRQHNLSSEKTLAHEAQRCINVQRLHVLVSTEGVQNLVARAQNGKFCIVFCLKNRYQSNIHVRGALIEAE